MLLLIRIAFVFLTMLAACDAKSPIQEFDLLEKDALLALKSQGNSLSDEQLTTGYCGTCHEFPKPEILDQSTWTSTVLPNMRRRLGLVYPGEPVLDGETLEGEVFHNAPLITKNNWKRIEKYYKENAPSTLDDQVENIEPTYGVPGFDLELPSTQLRQPSLTTGIFVDNNDTIYLGDRINGLFLMDGSQLTVHHILEGVNKVSHIFKNDQDELFALKMGEMDPADNFEGEWVEIRKEEERVIFDQLNRPVHLSFGKVTNEVDNDIIISNFGNHMGDLSLYTKKSTGWDRKVLLNRPGSRKSIITDLNGNGHNDIVVLITQAREAILVFLNQGDGTFKQKQLLSFHPAFGCTDFDMVDMNGNGKLDIVLSNGDNADLSKILKPYHGIRIFENRGEEHFEESWFYPMHGAMGLVTEDFDKDGHIDIAAISFFPDWNQEPRQDFIYFKGEGNLKFIPSVLGKPLKAKWLVIEKADLDGDGDMDIILGSFMLEQLPPKNGSPHYFEEEWLPIAVLRNQLLQN